MKRCSRPSCGLLVMLFLVLLAMPYEEVGVRRCEGRICESKSHRFHGTCIIDHNCAEVCRNEGFTGGHCVGFRHRCFCTRHC
ncbi:defensin-like protein 1 [Cucurbita moschata]|uniref:Defensin-like protein 1 n=1 Tax=Cucurbita moschata TaxID=3662 RepID=A0A6J1F103_CUCMO|nr:defensin-like protein 1 [Cucurbita moschata]